MAIKRPDGSRIPLGNKGRGASGFTPAGAAAPPGFQGKAGRFAPFLGSGSGSTARGFQPAQRQSFIPGQFAYRPESIDAPQLVAPAMHAVPLAQVVKQTGKANTPGRAAKAGAPAAQNRPSPMAMKASILAKHRRR